MSENMMRHAVLIHPNGSAEPKLLDISYPNVNRTLGVKWIEAIYAPGFTFYISEEGKLEGLPRNITAEAMFIGLGGLLRPDDYLCGPALILGEANEEGDDTDVPPGLIQIVYDVVAQLQADDLLEEK